MKYLIRFNEKLENENIILNQSIDKTFNLIKNKLGEKLLQKIKSVAIFRIEPNSKFCSCWDSQISIGEFSILRHGKQPKYSDGKWDGDWNLYFDKPLDETVLHELCHVFDNIIFGKKSKFGSIRSLTSDNWNFDPKNAPTKYGTDGKDEDFVASLMYYITDRKHLLKDGRDKFLEELINQYI